MIVKTRRSYSAPTLYKIGGGVLEGMDASGSAELPAERALWAENLWRAEDGCVCKRGGLRRERVFGIDGRVEWMVEFEGNTFCFYEGTLRREKAGRVWERPAVDAHYRQMGERLFIFCKGEWLVVNKRGITLLSPTGTADLSENFTAAASPWNIHSTVATIPLTHAGGRVNGGGAGVNPPNLLGPLVRESFVYTKSDRESKRNRFSLSFSPVVKGELPTAADGTHNNLDESDQAVRRATLSASARLEVRLEKTDAYGNTVSYWQIRPWTAADNLNADDGAMWINTIHTAALSFDGADNLRITYFRPELPETAELYQAHGSVMFGVGGIGDRLFLSAGQRLYYSGMDDGLYFGSLQYLDLGEKILLTGGQESVLTALSAESAWRIQGHAEKTAGEYALDAYFSVSERFPTPKPYGRECIVAGGELLFYSERGVCAVAPSGVMDERSVQVRSERLWGLLRREDPDRIRMGTWQDKLLLTGQNGVYLLDLNRKVKAEHPHSSHGYEGYFWSGLEADCFVAGDKLRFFRTGDLYTLADSGQPSDFHDETWVDGQLHQTPIRALWETGVLGEITRKGNFHALHLGLQMPTMLRIEALHRGGWQRLFDYDGAYRIFDYAAVQYDAWNYEGEFAIGFRRRLSFRARRHLRLRLINDLMDSPLRLQNFSVEYK